MDKLIKKIGICKEITNPFKKSLYILGIITEALAPYSIQPILVGGGAEEICNTYGYTLIQMETMPAHLHIFLSAPPTIAPTGIVKRIKSITSNRIFAEVPNHKKKYFWGSGLWSRGYYIGTVGNVSANYVSI